MTVSALRLPRKRHIVSALVSVAVLGSVLAIGTVHLATLLVMAPFAIAAGWISLMRPTRVPVAALICLALAYYCLLQTVPLPASWLEVLSPTSSDVWQRAARLTTHERSHFPLSLAPRSSATEALKWALYAGVVLAAATARAWFRTNFVVWLLFVSGLAVVATTVTHGLFRAEALYGVYRPTSGSPRFGLAPLINPNNLAGYLNLTIFAGLGLLLQARSVRRRWALGLGIASLIAVSVLSASRGGSIGLLLGSLLLASIPRRSKSKVSEKAEHRPLFVYGTVLVGAVLAVLSATSRTWNELFAANTSKLTMLTWNGPLVGDFPLTGIGRGAYQSVFPHYRPSIGGGAAQYAENFLLQWAAEWGLPVTLLAVCGFWFSVRRSPTGPRASTATLGVTIGMMVLLLHNLLDLALELPGVAIAAAAALGHLSGDSVAQVPFTSRAARAGLAGCLTLPFALALAAGGPGVEAELRAAGQALASARSAAALAEVSAKLREKVQQYPADPYLPYLAGVAENRLGRRAAISWFAHALERDPGSGASHIGLAQSLNRLGSTSQARLHIKLGAGIDPRWTDDAAKLALSWTTAPEELKQSVPEGVEGVPMLLALARKNENCRLTMTTEAAARSPMDPAANEAAAKALLARLTAGTAPCDPADRARCIAELRSYVQHLRMAQPEHHATHPLEMDLVSLTEGPAKAAVQQAAHCGDHGGAGCWRAAVHYARQAHDVEMLTRSGQAFLASSCDTSSQCAAAAAWLGDAHTSIGSDLAALELYSRAADEFPMPSYWLKLAQASERVGQLERARAARRRAQGP